MNPSDYRLGVSGSILYTSVHRHEMSAPAMESANPIYSMRAVVRCKAKQQLMQMQSDLDTPELMTDLNEDLLRDIATTLFESDKYAELYRACRSKRESFSIENELAAEIAKTYRQITLQQQTPLIQSLNALL